MDPDSDRPAADTRAEPAAEAPAEAVTDTSAHAPAHAPVTRINERSPRDMVLSLLILLLPIALLLGFNRFVLGGEEPTVVDPGPAVAQARAAGAFPVDQPIGLDQRWRPVRAGFQRDEHGATLRIGYLTPGGEGVQLVQSDVPADRLIPAELAGAARPEGVVDIAGTQWQRYPARPGERALVLLEPERSVVVVGAADEARLRELAGALRPA